MSKYLRARTRYNRGIGQAQTLDETRAALAYHLGDHGTQTAEGAVLLDRHHGAGTAGSLDNGILIQRLDAVHVEHGGGDAWLTRISAASTA